MATNMELMQRLKASVQEQTAGMQSVDAEELGEGFKIYFLPMTLKEQGRILKIIDKNGAEGLVETLISRSLDENGKKLFARAQRNEFLAQRGMDKFVTRIVDEMAELDAAATPEGTPDPAG